MLSNMMHTRDPLSCYLTLLRAHEQAAHACRPLLTDAGIEHLRRLMQALQTSDTLLVARPRWDAAWRRLYIGDRLLKVFRQPAPFQTAVLNAFETKGWPTSPITNPLPRETNESERDAQQRLHETAKNLNRGLPRNIVRFRRTHNMVLCEWNPKCDGDR
ncbi:MAG TPA: hypothetical protein VHR66_10130 [Gemmataceae bacterium]|jgi:hypothetical protein|nr:hypothetical protein [Gemmataceae bacterium]